MTLQQKIEQRAEKLYPDWERGTAFVPSRSAERAAYVTAWMEAIGEIEKAWEAGIEEFKSEQSWGDYVSWSDLEIAKSEYIDNLLNK